MITMYEKYLKEENGQEVLKNEKGFMIYEYIGEGPTKDECYVSDFYVDPDHRNTTAGKRLADELTVIAREHGARIMSATIWVDPTRMDYMSRKFSMFLRYGFLVKGINDNTVVLVKSLKEG